ncbi:MAG: sugar phosphate isomerase/epimerase [Chloroflexi bacterium]|nr:sugar phosphate isomerase/epimerase [Chloroflexota bacterium]MCL5274654.1 sugar phosphate isomerase/epimerase [Chloroflexota bacterium]
MKKYPVSIQLYSVREQAKHDFVGVLKKIAAMGYVGVEPAGLYGMDPIAVRKVLDDLGLKVSSNHGQLPAPENVNEIVDLAGVLGYTKHISGFGPDQFATEAGALKAAEQFQRAAELLKPHGIRYGFHNHWWEFDKKFNGKPPYELLLANAPDAFSELDTYWCAVGGDDPVRIVKTYGKRLPVLHIKDGSLDRNDNMTAVGDGRMDWQAVIGAADENTLEWLIVELDRCATDMLEAVGKSASYLAKAGFGVTR